MISNNYQEYLVLMINVYKDILTIKIINKNKDNKDNKIHNKVLIHKNKT